MPKNGNSEYKVFTKCTGLNDSTQITSVAYTPDGVTDITSCVDMTVTPEGKLVKAPALVNVFTHDTAITDIVAGNRMLIQDSVLLNSFNGTTVTPLTNSPTLQVGVKAKYISTPLDIRFSVGGEQYKVLNSANVVSTLALGTYVGPDISKVFSKMPVFTSGFMLGAKLYSTYGKFLQWSEDYSYDLYNIADNFIGHTSDILQSGAIPGCVVTLHATGVTVYSGNGPHDFIKTWYPCSVINGTLFSGFISKVYEYAHVFMCNDGVYIITSDGKLANLTVKNTDSLNTLNTSYNTVRIVDGKYLAYGNTVCVEYDFQVKGVFLRSTRSIIASCAFNNKNYFAAGLTLNTLSDSENTAATTCGVTFPYNDFGTDQTKNIRFVYFTGKITGTASVTVRNQFGQSVTKDISNIGYVQKYKITGLRPCKGNKLSLEFSSSSGAFKIEEISVETIACSSRN